MLIDAGDTHTTPTYEKLLRTIESESISYTVVRTGQKINLDPAVTIEVLSPEEPLGEDINDNSIVLRISSGKTVILMMGDAGKEVEKRIMSERSDLNADILKVGHHGSRHSSGKDFIQAVSTEVAIISLAAGNDYGYPQKEPLRYLTDAGARILRTDQEGTVTIRSNPGGYTVITGDETRDMAVCSCQEIDEFCRGTAGTHTPCCQACSG